ncbi:MAG: FAD-dependent oxidoreductase [Deltaproteobacteria bacterium]|nr:FAD-dependent oxidoreductase [Deltaproteobacteria bacterium]
MAGRELVCACEDVTRADVEAAVRRGYTDMESVKRYTGFGTGICQGKSCVAAVARLLAAAGAEPARLQPTTPRPPLNPTPLGLLAVGGDLPLLYPGADGAALTPPPPMPRSPAHQEPLPKRAEVVVIGGGIMGLATAYHLAKNGVHDVVVLERAYINSGASGRCGGGIRAQWSTEQNVLLMKESIAICREFAVELGINVWLRQGGYLFLAGNPAQMEAIAKNVALQNRLGVPTRILEPKGAKEIVPDLQIQDLQGACYNPEDGTLFPWPFLWGYANGAKAHGAKIVTFTPATGIDVEAGRVTGVLTARGRIGCNLVINAAAAWAPQIGRMAGITFPNRPERHEILVTESLKPFLKPLVSELGSGLYFSQSGRGEIVGGLGDPDEPEGIEMRSSLRFLVRMSRALVQRIPRLAEVKVLRQWAGCYDRTPDGNPILGYVDEVEGFFQVHGFVGHGFMMAPAVSKYVGLYLAKGQEHAIFKDNRAARFKDGGVKSHETLIIG